MIASFFEKIPRFFLVFFCVLFAAVWFVLFDSFRLYRAEAVALVFSKSPAVSAEGVAQNAAELVKTPAFYERLLADHEEISDPWFDRSASERNDLWSRVVRTDIPEGTSLIHLSVSSRERSQSITVLNASIETLYGFLGRFYDRDQEAGITLIDPVFVRPELGSPITLFLVSMLFAGALAFPLSFLFCRMLSLTMPLMFPRIARKIFSGSVKPILRPVGSFPDLPETMESLSQEDVKKEGVKEMPISISQSESNAEMKPELTENMNSSFSVTERVNEGTEERGGSNEPEDIWEKSKFLPAVSQSRVSSSVSTEGEKSVREESLNSLASEKKSATPGNLETIPAQDFAWEKVLTQSNLEESIVSAPKKVAVEQESGEISSKETPPERREPTPEELKARLNQLLRGEM